ncbi:glycoside hydrolase family 25 protein [Ramicandelaber brevisporus]|nr:glycoside hydrolase family 25 protein [Ramicandelaber brevisporus]
MRFTASIAALAALGSLAAAQDFTKGLAVDESQANANFAQAMSSGVKFAYVKATGGMSPKSPSFSMQYNNAAKAGLLRGAYHTAVPIQSPGPVQANYFVDNGGRWIPDGMTLPGALYLNHNPSGPSCYGLNPSDMVAWIHGFSETYRMRTNRYPVIRTTAKWWTECTGNNASFGTRNPLWVVIDTPTPGPSPAGWRAPTFMQIVNHNTNPDEVSFRGVSNDLKTFARGN